MKPLSDKQVSRFWARVDIRSSDQCWHWKGTGRRKNHSDYGSVWYNGTKHKTHRLALELSTGRKIPEGQMACHKCDNPPCCNPAHLFFGTAMDNTRDCIAKGRSNRESGSRRYNAKLSEEAVAEIKAQAPFRTYGWGRAMALKYGVGPTAINNIIRGRRWKQVGVSDPIEAVNNPHSFDINYVPLANRSAPSAY